MNVSQPDLNRRRNIAFSLRSATEATIGHLVIAIIAKKKETVTGQFKRQVILELFFDSSGIVHVEFIPEGATVNKHRYKEILRRLRNSVRRKCTELWRTKSWLLLHDNAPAHRSVLAK
jgi:hypothetical protein